MTPGEKFYLMTPWCGRLLVTYLGEPGYDASRDEVRDDFMNIQVAEGSREGLVSGVHSDALIPFDQEP
jgi:hypothetical protein